MKITTSGKKNGIQRTLWSQLDDLFFADDIVLLSQSHQQMQDKSSHLLEISSQVGLYKLRHDKDLESPYHQPRTSEAGWRSPRGGVVFHKPRQCGG